MTSLNQVYKCNICGNVVEVLHTGQGQLVCCGQPMELLEERAEEEGQPVSAPSGGATADKEKHLPVMEELPANVCQDKDGVVIKIGGTPHPMENEHYIEWIEVETVDGKRGKKFLQPSQKPQAEFNTRSQVVSARAYCNIHGLWKKQF